MVVFSYIYAFSYGFDKIKLGVTNDVEKRFQNYIHCTYTIPTEWKFICAKKVNTDARKIETILLHDILKDYRIAKNREFIWNTPESILKMTIYFENIDGSNFNLYDEINRKKEEKTAIKKSADVKKKEHINNTFIKPFIERLQQITNIDLDDCENKNITPEILEQIAMTFYNERVMICDAFSFREYSSCDKKDNDLHYGYCMYNRILKLYNYKLQKSNGKSHRRTKHYNIVKIE